MASSRRPGDNEHISTGGNSSRDFDLTNGEMSNWEELYDIDLRSGTGTGTTEVLEVYDDAASYDDRALFGGGTTEVNHFRIIRPASGQGHDGTPKNGVFFSVTTTAGPFDLREDYFQVQDMITKTVANLNGDMYNCLIYNCNHAAFVGCIALDSSNTWSGKDCFQFQSYPNQAGRVAYVVNCLAIRADDCNFRHTGDGTGYFYNDTGYGSDSIGFNSSTGTIVTTNCIAYESDYSTGDYYLVETVNYCASQDTTADNFGGTGNKANLTITFDDVGNDDYRTSDVDVVGEGNDLSGDGVYAFNDDLDGNIRTAWDMGCFEFAVAGVAPTAALYGSLTGPFAGPI